MRELYQKEYLNEHFNFFVETTRDILRIFFSGFISRRSFVLL